MFNPYGKEAIDGHMFKTIMPLIGPSAFTTPPMACPNPPWPRVGIDMSEDEIAALYHKADLDGSGEIEFEEFVFLFRNLNPRASAGKLFKFDAKEEPPKT